MHALWVSLKENMKCGTRLTDVVLGKQNGYNIPQRDDNISTENGHPMESQASLVVTTPSKTQPQLHELSVRDPSRKIVEMIFHRAWINNNTSNSSSSNPLKKVRIRTVFRVIHTTQALDRFEKYRENVKKKACIQQSPRHPRTIVDGNELLRFYVTTMRCCCCHYCHLCGDQSCCVCQIIHQFHNFEAQFCKGCDQMKMKKKKKNERRGAIVCRIIGGEEVEELNSNDMMQFRFENFAVRNPSAILPCFVIVLN